MNGARLVVLPADHPLWHPTDAELWALWEWQSHPWSLQALAERAAWLRGRRVRRRPFLAARGAVYLARAPRSAWLWSVLEFLASAARRRAQWTRRGRRLRTVGRPRGLVRYASQWRGLCPVRFGP